MKKLSLIMIAVTTLALVIESQTIVTNQGVSGSIVLTNIPLEYFRNDLVNYRTNLFKVWVVSSDLDETAFEFEYRVNGGKTIYTFSTNALKQLVEQLCAKGEICKVKGHNWRPGRPGEGPNLSYLDYHPGVNYRTCQTCGVCQSQTWEWK